MKLSKLIGLVAACTLAGNAHAVVCNDGNLSAYSNKFVYKDVAVSSSTKVASWNVTVTFDRAVAIERIWGASATKIDSKTYKVSSLPGKSLAANQTTTFGLKGTNSGKVASVSCSGSGASAPAPKPPVVAPTPTPKPPVTTPKPPVTAPSQPAGSVGGSQNNAGYIWYEDMNKLPSGSPDGKTWKALWGSPFINGDENNVLRYAIDDKVDLYKSGKSLRILYPKRQQRSKDSGAQWRSFIGKNYNELYIGYWVMFPSDFEWTLGGKLPGLGGSATFDNIDERTEGRMMWCANGLAEFYIHVSNVDDRQFQWNTEPGGQVYFKKGQWHYIEMRYVMNTVSGGKAQANGIMESWLHGKKAARYDDVVLRTSANVGFNHLQFSTFYGGGSKSGWTPNKDQHVWFDNIIINDSAIKAYPGYTPGK